MNSFSITYCKKIFFVVLFDQPNPVPLKRKVVRFLFFQSFN